LGYREEGEGGKAEAETLNFELPKGQKLDHFFTGDSLKKEILGCLRLPTLAYACLRALSIGKNLAAGTGPWNLSEGGKNMEAKKSMYKQRKKCVSI